MPATNNITRTDLLNADRLARKIMSTSKRTLEASARKDPARALGDLKRLALVSERLEKAEARLESAVRATW